ncbi:hypothetical protein ABPG74_008075 [Tetrahymena malaccensis]
MKNAFSSGKNKIIQIYQKMKENVLSENFSSYLVLGVVAFTSGIMGLSDLAVSYLYKDDYKLSPYQVSIAQSIVSLPWIFKPIWGLTSDCIPFMQYRRKSYLILCGLISFIMWSLMAYQIRQKFLGFGALFIIQLCGSFCSVIAEAIVVEISQKRAKANSDWSEEQQQAEAAKNVSLFFGIRSCGALVVAYLGGHLLEVFSKYTIFAITSCFPLMIVISSFFLDEDKTINNTTLVETTKYQIRQFWVFICKPEIYKPILYILAFMMMPCSGSAMFFFYTNVLGFQPEFLGQLRFIYASGSIFATLMYNKYLKNVPFKKQFTYSTIVSSIFGLTQILLVTRANQRLGIPDKVFTVSDSIMLQIIGEFNLIPILVMACRLCPKDIEGTMYALLMSTLNFGGIMSEQLGGVLTYSLGINETNFDNLWILVLITNFLQLTPLIYLNKIDINKAQEITGSTHQQQDSQDEEKSEAQQKASESQCCNDEDGKNLVNNQVNNTIQNEEDRLCEKSDENYDLNQSEQIKINNQIEQYIENYSGF